MDPRGGDPSASPPHGGAENLAWPEDTDSPAEARWRRSRIVGRYEDFLRCSVDWLWETDANLVLTFVSSPVALMLGTPAQVLTGRRLLSLGRFTTEGQVMEQPNPLTHLRPFRNASFAMTGADQREVTYLLSGVPYFGDDDGRFAGFRGTAVAAPKAQPAPSERATEEEFAALSQTLEETLLRNADLTWRLAQIERARAAGGAPPPAVPAPVPQAEPSHPPIALNRIAHELRTPLNAVMGYADLGLSQVFGALGERYLDCFRTIREAGRHMDELVAQLQATGQQPEPAGLASEVVDITAAVTKAKAMIALAARNAQVDISRVGPMAGGQVVGDHRACVQILLNLLSNAVKFTPPGGAVGLETVAGPSGTLQIVVWDSGMGISLDEQQKIFEPHFRAAGVSAEDKIPGHGLGLAISRDLARAMGGDISVISQPGQGSRFIFSLPIAGGAPTAP